MERHRNVYLSFWQDARVMDEFTSEDRYFYLYLLTNPHTNFCGCYEISVRQMAIETGYKQEQIEALLNKFSSNYNLIQYDQKTKELLVKNWHKYNWTDCKIKSDLRKEMQNVKTESFRNFLIKLFDKRFKNSGNEETQKQMAVNRAKVIQYLNEKCGTRYRSDSDITKRHIDARLKEGYTVDDLKTVIDKKCNEWKGTKLERFLRPQTLFSGKFESYLNQNIVDEKYRGRSAQMLDDFYDQTSEWVKKMEQEEHCDS